MRAALMRGPPARKDDLRVEIYDSLSDRTLLKKLAAGSGDFNAISAAHAMDLGPAQPFLGALRSCHRFADEAPGRWTVHCFV
jgi:hypothetical protein